MNNEEFLRLTTLYLEDAINADDLELLNRELTSSAERVQQFNDLRLVTGLIKEHGCPVESLSSTNDSFVAGFVQTTASQVRPSQRGLAIAGVILATAASLDRKSACRERV